jgi:hypothetical protein
MASEMTESELFQEASRHFGQKRYAEALEIANDLIKAGYAPAFMLRGLINEFGGDGIERNLQAARDAFADLSTKVSDPFVYIALARVLMKVGGKEAIGRAGKYIESAIEVKAFPDAWFIAGDFHNSKFNPWADEAFRSKAAGYYLRATLHGRILALREYAALQRLDGRPAFARMVLGISVILGPLFLILIGKKSLKTY